MSASPGGLEKRAPRGVLDRQVGRSVFGKDAALYDRARSAYPDELFAAIAARVPARPRVLEIGSGTGLATRGLTGLGPSRLVLVEPDAGMARFLGDRFPPPQAEVVCAPFLEAPVEGPFDLAACAAAFHWLEPEAAFARILALLADGGTCALWWNSYFGHGFPDPFGEAVLAFLRDQDVALPPSYVGGRHYAFDKAHHTGAMAAAGLLDVQSTVYSRSRTCTPQQARDLYATFSFIEILDADQKASVLDGIASIIKDDFSGEAVAVCATALYTALAS